MTDTFRVRIEDIRLPPNVPAGLNPLLLNAIAYTLRSTNNDPDPIIVATETDGWSLTDGRHRFIAAIIAGRPDVLCVADPNPPPPRHSNILNEPMETQP